MHMHLHLCLQPCSMSAHLHIPEWMEQPDVQYYFQRRIMFPSEPPNSRPPRPGVLGRGHSLTSWHSLNSCFMRQVHICLRLSITPRLFEQSGCERGAAGNVHLHLFSPPLPDFWCFLRIQFVVLLMDFWLPQLQSDLLRLCVNISSGVHVWINETQHQLQDLSLKLEKLDIK